MPPVHPPNATFLGDHLRRTREQTVAANSQQTNYIVNPATGVCQVIIGALQFDNKGAVTGLGAVWGIASFKTGSWVQVA